MSTLPGHYGVILVQCLCWSNRKFFQPATVTQILQFGFHPLRTAVEEFNKNKILSEEEGEVDVVGLASVPPHIQLVMTPGGGDGNAKTWALT